MSSQAIRKLFHVMDSARLRLRIWWGGYYKFLARCRGVEFRGSCRFMGRPKFKLYPGTRVVVGEGCVFLSGHTDNLIGVNRPCIVSVYNLGTVVDIGGGTGFSGTVIGAFRGITIGKNVKCGANTLITDGDWQPVDVRCGEPRPVVIGDIVWLGVGAMVLKGAKIGENTVIGANSVVTGEIPANVVAAGNPCRVIRSLG
jgi:acetyltransferase-like isoleucine patch superfamily enzyme